MSRLFVLGAADPEMAAIEAALTLAGEKFVHATIGGVRVMPSKAYEADEVKHSTHWVECGLMMTVPYVAVVLDHHRPGDRGFGGAPADFLKSSSLGQVLQVLGLEATEDQVLAAAADHCPGAAYAGLCPGVDPDALMAHRAQASAAFQKKTVEAVLVEVASATEAIKAAPRITLGDKEVADLRPGTVPGLPEACLRLGVAVIYEMAGNQKDPRRKVGILGAGEGTPAGIEPVKEFLATWAAAQGLVATYGDPVRGFAGGYVK